LIVLQEPEYGQGTVGLYSFQSKNVSILLDTIPLTALIVGLNIPAVTWYYWKSGQWVK